MNIPLKKELLKLQKDQLRHDELAHKDILCLPVQTRIKHMVLHFAKYTGHLIEASELQSHKLLVSTVVDSWIIVLASANMLNIRLSDKLIIEESEFENLHSLGEKLVSTFSLSTRNPYQLALFELGKVTGRMAKACESLDHLENFPSREILEQGVIEIARLLLALSFLLNLNVRSLISQRLEEVEQKSIFFHSEDKNAPPKEILFPLVQN